MSDKSKPRLRLSPELSDGQNYEIINLDGAVEVFREKLADWREHSGTTVGEGFRIDIVWMTDEEVEALPEL